MILISSVYLLLTSSSASAAYCSNDRPVLLTGQSGSLTDGSPAFQHSRPGSDCHWLYTPTTISNFTIEFSHWELNPSSDIDRIEISVVTTSNTESMSITETVVGKVSGYLNNPIYYNQKSVDPTVATAINATALLSEQAIALIRQQRKQFTIINLDPATQRVKIRFVTDPFGPQFDGFYAFWSVGVEYTMDKMAPCPYNCHEQYGRGICSLDGVCVCADGYSGAGCHNNDKKRLQNFYSACNGTHWKDNSGWMALHPCFNQPFNEISITAFINWAGVGGCVAGRVTSLQLPRNNISCPASAIKTLTFPPYTRNLDLSGNIVPAFPTSISDLSQLSVLSIAKSGMGGVLPASFFASHFPLLNLNLSSNALLGGFPDASWISGLLTLDLQNNQFEGWVPESVHNMAVPGSVWIDGNRFLCSSGISGLSTTDNDENSSALNPWSCVTAPGTHDIALAFDYAAYPLQSLPSHQFVVTVTCPAGSYIVDDSLIGRCLPCPTGGFCAGGITSAVSAPGFYESPVDDLVFLECFRSEYCLGNSTCSLESAGSRCAFCADGFVNVNGKCIVCEPGQSLGVAIGFVIAAAFLPAWWMWRAWLGDGNAAWGVMVMYFQIIGLFDKYPIYWDSRLGDVVKAVSVAILNTDYINLQCAYGLGYYPRLFLVWSVPFIIAVIFKLYVFLKSVWQSKSSGFHFNKHMLEWDQYAIQGFCAFLMLLHVPLTDRALRMFVCVTDPHDNRYYLSGTTDISCYDEAWTVASPIAGIFAILYGAGIPVAFLFLLYKNRSRVTDADVKKKYSILYSSYNSNAWYWTPAQMLWSLCFMFLPVIFRKRPTYLMFISVCLMYIYLFAVVYIRPYKLTRNNHVAIISWITIVIFLFAGIIVGFLQSGNEDNGWVIASVLALFYTSLVVVVHAFFYEIFLNADNAEQKGQGGGFFGMLMKLLPFLRIVFPRQCENGGDHETGGLKVDHVDDGIVKTVLCKADQDMTNVSLDMPTTQITETQPKNLSVIGQNLNLSWVVESGDVKQYSGDGFHSLKEEEDIGFVGTAKSLVSQRISDMKTAITGAAGTLASGMRGTHVQLRDDEDNHETKSAEREVSFVVD
ncbi:hypothetical protein BDR26DRAFT_853605 [Obelidium mucronatum]|nr:hypothetical protein BDR26DRAFT_853605 [Obelidium mucronatum]